MSGFFGTLLQVVKQLSVCLHFTFASQYFVESNQQTVTFHSNHGSGDKSVFGDGSVSRDRERNRLAVGRTRSYSLHNRYVRDVFIHVAVVLCASKTGTVKCGFTSGRTLDSSDGSLGSLRETAQEVCTPPPSQSTSSPLPTPLPRYRSKEEGASVFLCSVTTRRMVTSRVCLNASRKNRMVVSICSSTTPTPE